MIIRSKLLLLCCGILFSCKEAPVLVHEELVHTKKDLSEKDSLSIGSTTYFRMKDKGVPGLLYSYALPEERQNKHFDIVFSGKAKSNFAQTTGGIVFIALDKNNSQLCWWSLSFRPHMVYTDRWNVFRDSLYVRGLINDVVYTTVQAFPYMGNSTGEVVEVDSFRVQLKQRPEY